LGTTTDGCLTLSTGGRSLAALCRRREFHQSIHPAVASSTCCGEGRRHLAIERLYGHLVEQIGPDTFDGVSCSAPPAIYDDVDNPLAARMNLLNLTWKRG
jgi:hypothetical protein